MIETIASVATAFGVLLTAFGILYARRTMVGTFEQTFNDRYRQLRASFPIELLRGELDLDRTLSEDEERAVLLYLELCEEELYFRRHGKISSSTWVDWWDGIRSSVRTGILRERLDADRTAHSYLRRSLDDVDDLHDPATLKVRTLASAHHWNRRVRAERAACEHEGST